MVVVAAEEEPSPGYVFIVEGVSILVLLLFSCCHVKKGQNDQRQLTKRELSPTRSIAMEIDSQNFAILETDSFVSQTRFVMRTVTTTSTPVQRVGLALHQPHAESAQRRQRPEKNNQSIRRYLHHTHPQPAVTTWCLPQSIF